MEKEGSKTPGTLDPAYPAPSTQRFNPVDDLPADPIADSLLNWLDKRGDEGALVGNIQAAGLAVLKGMGADEIREYLDVMVAEQSIELIGKRYRVL